jgi:hypothetical protein
MPLGFCYLVGFQDNNWINAPSSQHGRIVSIFRHSECGRGFKDPHLSYEVGYNSARDALKPRIGAFPLTMIPFFTTRSNAIVTG